MSVRAAPDGSLKRLEALVTSRFIRYCICGGSGATLDFLTYSALVGWAGLPLQVANAIGYACGTLLSFFLNAWWTFKTRDFLPLRLASFFMVAALGWATSASLLYVAVEQMGVDKYAAKAATIVVVVLVQYNLNRLISFRSAFRD